MLVGAFLLAIKLEEIEPAGITNTEMKRWFAKKLFQTFLHSIVV